MNNNLKTLHYSSGETIAPVGMLKYTILQIIEKILSINEIENLALDFTKFDLFGMIEVILL